jgi:hypothetical protein
MGILWTKPLKMQKFFTHFRHPKVIEDATKKVGHSHYFLKNINKTGLPPESTQKSFQQLIINIINLLLIIYYANEEAFIMDYPC